MSRQSTTLAAILLTCCCALAHGFQGKGGGGGGGGGSTPPPNPEIAHVSNDLRTLFVMNADGTNSRSVTSFPKGSSIRGPCWSPDRSQLVFYGMLGSVHGLFVVNADGTGLSQIVSFPPYTAGATAFPDWSRVPAADGRHKITFAMEGVQVLSILHKPDIFIVNPDGTGLLNVTSSGAVSEYYSCWSSDASRLYIQGSNGLALDAVELTLVGGELAVAGQSTLWTGASGSMSFLWLRSGPGSRLCYSAPTTAGPLRVYTFDAATPWVAPVLLTAASSSEERFASFSPDGSRLAFHRSGTTGGAFTIGADGSGEVRILAKLGIDTNWSR
jgi:Tol biopolymer transport system component